MNKVKAPPKPNPLPMTNEEYLRSCTNEELQNALWHIRYDRESPWKGKSMDEWLKEIHHAN